MVDQGPNQQERPQSVPLPGCQPFVLEVLKQRFGAAAHGGLLVAIRVYQRAGTRSVTGRRGRHVAACWCPSEPPLGLEPRPEVDDAPLAVLAPLAVPVRIFPHRSWQPARLASFLDDNPHHELGPERAPLIRIETLIEELARRHRRKIHRSPASRAGQFPLLGYRSTTPRCLARCRIPCRPKDADRSRKRMPSVWTRFLLAKNRFGPAFPPR